MPFYTFPYGTSAFGIPQSASAYNVPVSTGNYFFVSSVSGSNTNNGTSPATPFATIKYAASRCVANNYDVIVMMPGHAETISTAAYITPVAGTILCGVGSGSLRPTLTWSLTTSTIVCSAANLTFQNFLCNNSVTEVVTMFSCSAADLTFMGVDYNEAGGAYAVAAFITASSACNRLSIQQCYHINTTACTTATVGWITVTGTDGLKIWDNVFMVNRVAAAQSGVIVGLTTLSSNVSILRNTIGSMTTGASNMAISLITASTGIAAYNNVYNLGKAATAGSFGASTLAHFQNFSARDAGRLGIADPLIDT